jgi:hypothetical protein
MIFLVNSGSIRGKIYRPVKATGQLPPFGKKAGRSFLPFPIYQLGVPYRAGDEGVLRETGAACRALSLL